jgi:uncharacterized protein (TIGR00106 family)
MYLIADVCVIPMKECDSLADDIACCQRILQARGLTHQMHAFGTNIEGPWDEVIAAIKDFHETLHQKGNTRITSTLRLGTRSDESTSIQEKIARVEHLLDNTLDNN